VKLVTLRLEPAADRRQGSLFTKPRLVIPEKSAPRTARDWISVLQRLMHQGNELRTKRVLDLDDSVPIPERPKPGQPNELVPNRHFRLLRSLIRAEPMITIRAGPRMPLIRTPLTEQQFVAPLAAHGSLPILAVDAEVISEPGLFEQAIFGDAHG
jgi:hypothetical protein